MITWCIIGGLLVYLIYELYKTIKHGVEINKMGGPKTSMFGNLFDIMVPYDVFFRKLRKWSVEYYPIYRLWAAYVPTINVVSPEDVEVLMSTMKHTDKHLPYTMLEEWLGTGLLTSGGKKWQTRRKLLTPTFHFDILQQFIPIFLEHGEDLANTFEGLCGKPSVEIVSYVTNTTLKTICETSMGTKLTEKDETYRNTVEQVGANMVHRLQRFWMYNPILYFLSPVSYRQRKLIKYLHKFSNDVINKRRLDKLNISNLIDDNENMYQKKKRLAMLDLLIQHEQGTIDQEGIREEVDTFVFEGHDTTGMSICFTFMLLANNKHIQDRVIDELKRILVTPDCKVTHDHLKQMQYLDLVIKESLRLYPSVPFIGRTTSEDMITASGYFLPKGAQVNIHIYDLHRLPHIYPEPNKFDPDRFLPENVKDRHIYAYVPFSAGPRNCIGQKFAMLEMKAIIALVLKKVELLPVDTPETVVLKTDIIIRTKNGIKLAFKRRAF